MPWATASDFSIVGRNSGPGVVEPDIVCWASEGVSVYHCRVWNACDRRFGSDRGTVLLAEVSVNRGDRPVVQFLGSVGLYNAPLWPIAAFRLRRRLPCGGRFRLKGTAMETFWVRRGAGQVVCQRRPPRRLEVSARRLGDGAIWFWLGVGAVHRYGPWGCVRDHIGDGRAWIRFNRSGSAVAERRGRHVRVSRLDHVRSRSDNTCRRGAKDRV